MEEMVSFCKFIFNFWNPSRQQFCEVFPQKLCRHLQNFWATAGRQLFEGRVRAETLVQIVGQLVNGVDTKIADSASVYTEFVQRYP